MGQAVSEGPGPTAIDESNREPSDRSLLRRFQHGQQDAATLLYQRYAKRLHALAAAQCLPDLARRVDPDDIVQSVFRTFFRRAAEGHYDVPAGEELWKLFLVIALNKVRRAGLFHRAAKRDVRKTADGDAYEQALQDDTGQDEVALTVLRLVIEQTMAGLPRSHRQIVELRIQEYEVPEIAGITQRSMRTVERVLQQFRQKLSDALCEDEDD
ncbi:MAG: sigma-70 family RNA polymerase sigma factor [Planctomycetes bacterium]|nr:sigma-70 family RNA polymerase sigma factor [Planctomycetota bacterium]